MVLQIEDCVDCLTHLLPQFNYEFELDHSSAHNAENSDGLSDSSSVLNLGWGGKQRKIRSSPLTADDIDTLTHARTIKVGSLQLMVFSVNDNPLSLIQPHRNTTNRFQVKMSRGPSTKWD